MHSHTAEELQRVTDLTNSSAAVILYNHVHKDIIIMSMFQDPTNLKLCNFSQRCNVSQRCRIFPVSEILLLHKYQIDLLKFGTHE